MKHHHSCVRAPAPVSVLELKGGGSGGAFGGKRREKNWREELSANSGRISEDLEQFSLHLDFSTVNLAGLL